MSNFAKNTTVVFRTRDGRVEVYRSDIEKYPNSMLARMLDNSRDENGTYYLNIDTANFHKILNYISEGIFLTDDYYFNYYTKLYIIDVPQTWNEYKKVFSKDSYDEKLMWSRLRWKYDNGIPRYVCGLTKDIFVNFTGNLYEFVDSTYNLVDSYDIYSRYETILLLESINGSFCEYYYCIRKDHFDDLSIFKRYHKYVKKFEMDYMKKKFPKEYENKYSSDKLKDIYYLSPESFLYRKDIYKRIQTYIAKFKQYYDDLSPNNE